MSHDQRIIPRKDWGARSPRSVVRQPVPARLVVLHHTASSMPGSYHDERPHRLATRQLERQALREVQGFHMDSRGWADIAYQYIIFGSGNIYRGRGRNIGAHADGYNTTGVGICFYGYFAPGRDQLDPDAKAACIWLINRLQRGKNPQLTEAESMSIQGHGQLPGQGTACPGLITRWIPDIYKAT